MYLADSGKLLNGGLITLAAAAYSSALLTIAVGGVLQNPGTISGGGTIENAGVIGSGGRGATTGLIAVTSLVNDGTVRVATSGALTVDSTVTADAGQHGVFDLLQHGALTLGGSVAGQEIAFIGCPYDAGAVAMRAGSQACWRGCNRMTRSISWGST